MLFKTIYKLINNFLEVVDKRRVDFYYRKFEKQVSIGNRVSMGSGSSVFILPTGKDAFLTIKDDTNFRRFCTLTLDSKANLLIGFNNFFNNGCSINCLNSIVIGDNNLFGEDVKIYDHNHLFSDKDKLIVEQGFKTGSVLIGNNCWIGSNTIILNNVSIGDNVIIGACNLIYKSIPSNTIIKSNSSYAQSKYFG